MLVGYARVSTADQNPELQLDALKAAGCERVFVEKVYEGSGGIPRLISVICDNSLISGFAADRRPVDREIVADVCRDFDLEVKSAAPAPVVAPVAASVSAHAPAPPPRQEHAGKGLFEHFSVRKKFSIF